MMNPLPTYRIPVFRCRALLLPAVLLFAAGAVTGQEQVATSDAVPPPKLTLAECLRIARDHQPALAGHRASLAAASAQLRGLNQIPIPSCLSRDLAVRRQQSEMGVTVAAAGLDQSVHETVYAVTRTYMAVLYARRQEAVAREAVDKLKLSRQNANRLLKAGNPDVTQSDVDKLDVYVALAESRRFEAAQGTERATAALREAMGVGPDSGLEPAEGPIPYTKRDFDVKELIALALARRGEMTQASTVADVVELEIKAQGYSHKLKKETFAAVVDLHARQIPQGTTNGEYRPGALGLEVPTTMAGPRSARVERTQDLHDRALAVVEKTRGLIALEVEDAYLKWREAANRVAALEGTPDRASKLADTTMNRFAEGGKVPAEDVVRSSLVSSQAQASYNEALYQHALGLAALERVTAGGVDAGLIGEAPQKP
jgi:outer membrane protein TolC